MISSKIKKHTFVPVFITLTLVMSTFMTGCGQKEVQHTRATVNTVSISRHTITDLLETKGTVVSKKIVTYCSPVNAPVAEIRANIGDTIPANTQIVTFNLDTLEADNQKAAFDAASESANLEDTKARDAARAEAIANAKSRVASLNEQISVKEAEISDLNNKLESIHASAENDAQKKYEEAVKKYQADIKTADDTVAGAQAAYDAMAKDYSKDNAALEELNNQLQLAQPTPTPGGDITGTGSEGTGDGGGTETDPGSETDGESDANKDKDGNNNSSQNTENNSNGENNSSGEDNVEVPVNPELEALKTQVTEAETVAQKTGAQLGQLLDQLNSARSERDAIANNPPANQAVTVDDTDLNAALSSAGNDLASFKAELDNILPIANADTTPTDLEQMRVKTNLADLKKKSIDELIADGKQGISTGFDGIITDVKVKKDASVTQGAELFTVASTGDLAIDAALPDKSNEKIKTGQQADIVLADKTYAGTVDAIEKSTSSKEKDAPVSATIHITKPDKDLQLNAATNIKIHLAEKKNVIAVPNDAVFTDDKGSFCYTVKKGKLQKANVETGISDTSFTEIKKGLTIKDKLIPSPGNASVGDSVKIISENTN